ncbi:MAG: low molecular weight protein-tyrosine-phosphatase [Halothiobacillaceae bacterium]
MNKQTVLFVCMGNICRSPTAEGLFRHLIEQAGLIDHVEIDSAGTHAYHVGNPPDPRAQAAARDRGIDLSMLRARQVGESDLLRFDHVLAMDEDNLAILRRIASAHGLEHKPRLFLEYAPQLNEREVPDPYYGGDAGFARVFDLIEAASEGLIAELRRRQAE